MTAKTPIRTAPEIIATVLGWDWLEVKDNVYQPTRYRAPRVYTVGHAYVCCPTDRQRLPPADHFNATWEVIGEAYGRKVYRNGTP